MTPPEDAVNTVELHEGISKVMQSRQRIRPQDERLTLPEYTRKQRKCGVRFIMTGPASQALVFNCTKEGGHVKAGDPVHHEEGRVRSRDSNIAVYTLVWQSVKQEVWRS